MTLFSPARGHFEVLPIRNSVVDHGPDSKVLPGTPGWSPIVESALMSYVTVEIINNIALLTGTKSLIEQERSCMIIISDARRGTPYTHPRYKCIVMAE